MYPLGNRELVQRRTDAAMSYSFWFSPCSLWNDKPPLHSYRVYLQLPLNPVQEGCHVKTFPSRVLRRFFAFGRACDSPVYKWEQDTVSLSSTPTLQWEYLVNWVDFPYVNFVAIIVFFSSFYFKLQTCIHKPLIIDFLCSHAYLAYFFQLSKNKSPF